MPDATRSKGARRGGAAPPGPVPFATASVDVVLVVHVFHLIPDWPLALREALRVPRPGDHCNYGSERNGAASEARPINERWRALLSARGITPCNHRSTGEAVQAALRADSRRVRRRWRVRPGKRRWRDSSRATPAATTAHPGVSPIRSSPRPTPHLLSGPAAHTLHRDNKPSRARSSRVQLRVREDTAIQSYAYLTAFQYCRVGPTVHSS